MRPSSTLATFFAIAGLILLPVTIFLFGQFMAGAYDGSGGIFGFLGDIYGDLLRGRLLAWTIVACPALLIAVWWLALKIGFQRQRPTASPPAE